MSPRKRLTPQQAESVLSGRTSAGDPEHGRLVRALGQLRDANTRTPSAGVKDTHLAAMTEAYEPASGIAQKSPRRRRGFALRTGLVAAGAVLVAGSALAATGSLPDAAQNAVADVVSSVGLNLPGGNDETQVTPAPAEAGKAGAEENRARAEEFTAAKQAWTACVAEKAPAHEGPEAFDPEEACGPKPQPSAVPEEPGQPADPGANAPDDHPGSGAPADPGQGDEHKPADAGQPDQPGNSADHKPGS
jgi:hypothetical protein